VGHELLDRALAILTGRQGRKPKDALPKVAKGLPEAGYHWLALRGAVARHEHRVLWVFPVVRHRVVGPELARIHSLTAEVLLGRVAPDLRSGALLALLEVVGAVPKVFAGVGGLSGRELRARAKQVGAGDWASEAVRKAISD